MPIKSLRQTSNHCPTIVGWEGRPEKA